jgi:hypothetical protein
MAISRAVNLSTQGRNRNGSTSRVFFQKSLIGNVADPDRLEPSA